VDHSSKGCRREGVGIQVIAPHNGVTRLRASAKVEVDCARLVARGIGVVPTLGTVIVSGADGGGPNGSGPNAHARAVETAPPRDSSTVDAASPRDTAAIAASVRQGIGRNTRDAKSGNQSDGDKGSS
jgi:hypothetical protein